MILKLLLIWRMIGTQSSSHEERRNRALAIIVLSVELSLLYLIGDPEDPVSVWEKLTNFRKKHGLTSWNCSVIFSLCS